MSSQQQNGLVHLLSALRVATLELDYKESKHVDDYGNKFSYRAKVKGLDGAQLGRWAYDVTITTSSQ
jgi:hypothetical protein